MTRLWPAKNRGRTSKKVTSKLKEMSYVPTIESLQTGAGTETKRKASTSRAAFLPNLYEVLAEPSYHDVSRVTLVL